MRFPVERIERRTVVLGPCPGCTLWSVEYTREAVATFGDIALFHAALEDLLQEHLAECRHLRWLLA